MNLEQLKQYIKQPDVVCALSNGNITLTSNLAGVRPWMQWLRECPETLINATVADRVVGKAAAMLMIKAGIKALHTPLMSQHAYLYLRNQSIEFTFDQIVPYITNREKNDICPLEKVVLDESDAEIGYQKICEKIAILMNKKEQ